jgi:hypothetical protein
MNFTPKFNQLGLKWYLENNNKSKLDHIDAILLNEINTLIENWTSMHKIERNGQTYFNIGYKKLFDQLPTLGMKKETMAKRIRQGLFKEGLIDIFIDKKNNSNVFFYITPLGYKCVRYRTNVREGIAQTCERVSHERATNKNIDNKNINNKRGYTHFNFLESNYPEEMKIIFEKYPLKDEEKKKCIDYFNDYKIKTIKPKPHQFEKCISNWYRNEKRNELISKNTEVDFSKMKF